MSLSNKLRPFLGVVLRSCLYKGSVTTRAIFLPASSTINGSRCYSATDSGSDHIFRQLLDYNTFTYTYLLADKSSRQGVLIDPVLQMVDRDVKLAQELGVDLIYGINTHMHADHITGTGELKKRIKNFQTIIGKHTSAKSDIYIDDRDIIKFGKFQLECRSTPGHTDGCMTFVWHEKEMAFTGDALLIRGCGRTDFQQGSSAKLYKSCQTRILSLPGHFFLYPCHDYQGRTVTTVDEEKKWNLRLTKSLEEFTKIMSNLNLGPPKYINEAIPANLNDGIVEEQKKDGVAK